MTQENKFAIVIGFALLLVVGILVSDHLAELARGDAGTLMAIDPLEPNGGIIEYQPLIHPDPVPTVPASEMAVPATTGMTVIVHTVGRGETLSQVALKQYGDRSLANSLGTYNKLPHPDRLVIGQRLLIPNRHDLASAPPTMAAQQSPTAIAKAAAVPNVAEYVVASGDTLSELAQKLMGSARHTNELLSMNKDRVPTADSLRVGTRLRYPATELQARQ
ncbi:MAG: LysM domain-containing protein [Phycisphaerales bacterium]|nr:LysM domain-containing protein [Phycisphaerales bacterium]